MADQPPAPVVEPGAAPTPVTPETPPAAPPQLTRESIEKMRRDRDGEGLSNAIGAAVKPSPAGTPAPQPQPAPAAGSPPDGQPAAAPPPKVFTIKREGKEIELGDGDSYLGYGDFGKLKKAAAHAKVTLQEYQGRVSRMGTESAATKQRLATLEAENEELQTQLAGVQRPPEQPAPVAPVAPPQPAPTPAPQGEKIDIPQPPVEPEYSSDDPLEWNEEDRKKRAEYRTARREYDQKMAAAVTVLAERKPIVQTQPSGQYRNDPALVQKVEDLTTFVAEEQGKRQQEQEKRRIDNFWKDLDAFQGLHTEELGTPVDLRVLHGKTKAWMDNLAITCGVELPENATAQDVASYQEQCKSLVERYRKGDPEVVERAQGVEPPEGYQNYFKVADWQKKRTRLVNEKVFAQNATLQDAWQHLYAGDGLTEDIDALEVGARAEGASTMLTSLKGHQQNDAVTIPNSKAAPPGAPGQAAPAGQGDDLQITKEEALRILAIPIQQVRRDPELMRKRELILKRARPV